MPYHIERTTSGKYRVTSPHGVKASGTTQAKARAQVRLLQGVKHGWRPTGRRS